MDWNGIGQWAGDKGPFLAIIAIQFRIIHMLLTRFFKQQEILTDAMRVSSRAIDVAEQNSEHSV